MLTAFAVYFVAFNNYFSFDDFIWLNRARTLNQDWRQIFRPDVSYFDPLVHLTFWADYKIAGLDNRWYHFVDLTLHAANALLVYRFARLLNGDDRAAVYAGVLFASSFAIADGVLWPSSRVDLLATLCALGSLIQFLEYLRNGTRRSLYFSFLLFVLALSSKGTPLVLPAILFWLIIQEGKPVRFALSLVPFGLVVIIYLVLVKLSMYQAPLPLDRWHFNIHNICLAFCSLFIPEGTLKFMDVTRTSYLLFVLVSVIALAARTNVMLRRTGYCILAAALMPVLIITDLKLVYEFADPVQLLASPSHRIYLASVGVALLAGGFLRSAESLFHRSFPRITIVVVVLLAGIVVGNAWQVRERDQLWEAVGDRSRSAVEGLLPYRQQIVEGSQIGLIYFPGSTGFLTPLVKLSLNRDNLAIMSKVTLGMIRDQDILRKAENSFLFVLDSNGHVQDKSRLFRQQLLLNRLAIQYPDHPEYGYECQSIAGRLIREIE